jgi:hypothetical protein
MMKREYKIVKKDKAGLDAVKTPTAIDVAWAAGCGDRARVFLGCIYPFMTSRRKAQIESTSANDFLEYVADLLHPVFGSEPYTVYESLWERVKQNVDIQRKKALEHRRKYHTEYELKRANDLVYREKKREAQRQRRKLAKEQKLHLVEMQKSA